MQKIAVLSLGYRTSEAARILEAFARVGLEGNCVVDVNALIVSKTSPDGYPDRRGGVRIEAQLDIIGHPQFAAAVIECLKASTLSPDDGNEFPIHIRVSDGPTVADIVGRG